MGKTIFYPSCCVCTNTLSLDEEDDEANEVELVCMWCGNRSFLNRDVYYKMTNNKKIKVHVKYTVEETERENT